MTNASHEAFQMPRAIATMKAGKMCDATDFLLHERKDGLFNRFYIAQTLYGFHWGLFLASSNLSWLNRYTFTRHHCEMGKREP